MFVDPDARQRGHRFALASSRNHADALSWMVPDIFRTDDESRRHVQESELLGNLSILRHPATEKTDQPAMLLRLIDYELKTWNRRRETRQNDAALRCAKDRFQPVVHR